MPILSLFENNIYFNVADFNRLVTVLDLSLQKYRPRANIKKKHSIRNMVGCFGATANLATTKVDLTRWVALQPVCSN